MRLSAFFPKRFGSRLFIMTMIAGFIPIAIFSVLLQVFGNNLESRVRQAVEERYQEEWERSSLLLTRIGETYIRNKALDIAGQLELILQSHPYMTLGDLRRDKKFRSMAVQTIGHRGYTGLFETNSATIWFHRDRAMESLNAQRFQKTLPEYWKIINAARGGKTSGGYYDWKEENGSLSKKYMFIVPLSQPTADARRLGLFVTTYLDEFTQPLRQAHAIQRETARDVLYTTSSLIESVRKNGFLLMGIGILIVSLAALLIGRYLSQGITRLSDATKKVNDGDLTIHVDPVPSGEIRTLMEDFNRMVLSLNATTVSKELLEESEKKLIQANNDLRREIRTRSIAEEALAIEKGLLSVTLRSIADAVISVDTSGKIVFSNRAARELAGFAEDEAQGRPFSEIFRFKGLRAQDDDDPINFLLREAKFSEPCTLIRRNGTERLIEKNASAILDKDNAKRAGVVVVLRDVTEQRRMETELLRARKLESIGTLAGGIAHDFNNLLAVILGNISFAKMLIQKDQKALKRLDEAEKSTIRGKDLSYRLLTFARGAAPVRKVTVLYDLIRDAAELTVAGSKSECKYHFPKNLFKVSVDEGQIRQVIHNLVLNARESMPDGGMVKITVENMYLTNVEGSDRQPGNYVRISVQDEGMGILPENIDRVFDPYFTTKEMGSEKGMGLGLAICYSIVKSHSGFITLHSEPGNGTAALVYLPALGPDQKSINASPALSPKETKILYMDDEEQSREMAGKLLRDIGCNVEFARDGAEAIALFKKGAAAGVPYDLVVLDLTVPGRMGGREALDGILTINPKAKAIVSSRHLNETMAREYEEYGFSGFVTKPYSLEELQRVIKDVLSEIY